jgi:osmotically-inducible protein OsmY
VVDANGVLVGIVTKSDLVKVFLRTDEAIRRDILDHVLGEVLLVEPATVDVEVVDGNVRLSGQLERKMLQLQLLDQVWRVAGVVGVTNVLTYRIDDSVVTRVWPAGGA